MKIHITTGSARLERGILIRTFWLANEGLRVLARLDSEREIAEMIAGWQPPMSPRDVIHPIRLRPDGAGAQVEVRVARGRDVLETICAEFAQFGPVCVDLSADGWAISYTDAEGRRESLVLDRSALGRGEGLTIGVSDIIFHG